MPPLVLFILLLLLSFGVLAFFLRPTRTEMAIQRHLEGIEKGRVSTADGVTILKEEGFTAIPWLYELIRQVPGSLALLRLVKQAGSKQKVATFMLFSLLAAPLAWWLASFWISNIALSAGIGVAVGVSPYGYLYILRGVRFHRCDAVLPEAIDLMARGLRAGHSIASVLDMVGQEIAEPLASEFRTVSEEQTLGLPTREAMLNLVERLPRDDVRFLATAILVQKETGGNLAQILDKTAAVMRERVRLRGQLRIYTAQGRITGWILCSLPFILFGLISLVNPDYEKILFTDPLGVRLIYGGLGMMAVGVLIIRKVIDIRV